ncbi:hypothetical protein M9H77_21416 [Catharanthus roseus]|uniref:Uncharacterized protein n=1 Tax=Catharanthus roseus TaxID=4058 RepID=A0ACC0ARL6_CATRO|nr:hypothetical protein M9H77_21416 [Catharanthus roseus]
MGSGKKKIEIKKIEKESRRMVTFSKRRKGLFKKADELCSKTGAKVAIVVISASGKPYPYGDIEAIDTALNNSGGGGCNFNAYGVVRESSSYGVPSRGNNISFKKWLNEINVEQCDDIKKLLMLKKELEEAKETILRAEVESWTL